MKAGLMSSLMLALLVAAWMPAPASAASADELQKQFLAKIDDLLPGMGAEKIEDRQEPQMAFERICMENSTPDHQVERAALCKAIMQRVGPDVAKPARVWLLRKVEPIGREEVVAGLDPLLAEKDNEIRDLAKRALANNPAPQAAAALRAGLDDAKHPGWRVALINALAWRGDVQAVPQMIALSEQENRSVAVAAITALGQIADDRAVEALARLRKQKDSQKLRPAIVDASFHAAEALIARGANDKAAAIYASFNNPKVPEKTRITALQGLAAAKGAGALPALLRLINGPDERLQIVAARCAQELSGGEKVTRQICDALEQASPDSQAVLLEALGKRGDPTAMPAVVKFIQAGNHDVRIAAIGALRYVGNEPVVEELARVAAQSTGPERDAARESLKWMRGQAVDDTIMSSIGKVDERVAAELVRAASVRLMKAALPAMYKFVNYADETVRIPVIYNVGKLAMPADLPVVLKAFSQLEADQNLDTAKDALVRICSRISGENERTRPLIQALNGAKPIAQVIILQALGELRGQAALEAIREARRSASEPSVKQAATKALAAWGPVYCTEWVFSGPYQNEGATHADLFDVAFPPEDADAKVEWKPLTGQKGRNIDLEKMARQDNCCGYLRTTIIAEQDQDVVLSFGSDDGLKVWVNGKVVHANNATRGLTLDEDKVSVKLDKGANVVLAKVTNGGGQWAFACGIAAAQGGPPDTLKFEAK